MGERLFVDVNFWIPRPAIADLFRWRLEYFPDSLFFIRHVQIEFDNFSEVREGEMAFHNVAKLKNLFEFFDREQRRSFLRLKIPQVMEVLADRVKDTKDEHSVLEILEQRNVQRPEERQVEFLVVDGFIDVVELGAVEYNYCLESRAAMGVQKPRLVRFSHYYFTQRISLFNQLLRSEPCFESWLR